jgi:hypothetical protein
MYATELSAEVFLPIALSCKMALCVDQSAAELVAPAPRAVRSGLVDRAGAGVFCWPDGLCLVSSEVWEALGGEFEPEV